MKKQFFSLLTILTLLYASALADEGMWIPLLLDRYNIAEMQEMGFKLTAEDIYSVNHASMKDAIVQFGGGCTAELISGQGLLLTNHHCGFSRIQSHSSLEHDYLTNGFWAMSKEEELPNPGLTVTFLVRMEDVTGRVLEGVSDDMSPLERETIIRSRAMKIMDEAVAGTHYTASVRPFYNGNQYFLFVNEVFRDVRLVGAPPSAIGKFGGDTDNWEWPRHTGDFSLFRVYADKNNMPADYSPDNVPYTPKKFFSVSLKGVKPGDFTMVFGYPGSTSQYVPSDYIEMLTESLYPMLIGLRDVKLDVMYADMDASPRVRIQYAAKAQGQSNSWKRWIGESKGLKKLDVAGKKKAFEEKFSQWVAADPDRNQKYGQILEDYHRLYDEYEKVRLLRDCYNEVFFRQGIELISFAGGFRVLDDYYRADSAAGAFRAPVKQLLNRAHSFYEDYNQPTDRKLFAGLARLFDADVDGSMQPAIFHEMKGKYGNDFEAWSQAFYGKSWIDDQPAVEAFLDNFNPRAVKKLEKDPAYQLFTQAFAIYSERILPDFFRLSNEIGELDRLYMKAIMEFRKGERLYPDANSTLRVAYGQIKGYDPRDAVHYVYYTTLRGVMEKDNPDIYDYRVPEKLKELYRDRDYGRYGENGEMHICFLANNHTTGGNSGSPVIDADGRLIGVNFDRVWEGVMSDLMFNPEQSRNISLDIRYVLFLIDKFAGAGYLVDEMNVVE